MIYGKVDNPPAQPFQNIGMAVNVLQIIFCIHIWIEVASRGQHSHTLNARGFCQYLGDPVSGVLLTAGVKRPQNRYNAWEQDAEGMGQGNMVKICLLYTSPSPRD